MQYLNKISKKSYEYAERVADLSSKYYKTKEPVKVVVEEGGVVILHPTNNGWECSAEVSPEKEC